MDSETVTELEALLEACARLCVAQAMKHSVHRGLSFAAVLTASIFKAVHAVSPFSMR